MLENGVITYFPFAFKMIIFAFLLAFASRPIRQFLAPVTNEETWYFMFSRLTVSILILIMPFAYDAFVPEVAGDIRWYMMHFSGLGLLTLFFTYYFLKYKNKKNVLFNFKLTPTSWAVAIAVLFAFLTLIWGISLPNNWWFFKNFIGYALIFSFALHLKNEEWYINLIWLLSIGVAFNGLLGILQFFAITDAHIVKYIPFAENMKVIGFFQQSAPPAGAFSNKNLAASFMLMCMPLMSYLMITSKSNIKLIISTVALTLASILLIYTRSRGSWLSAISVIVFAGIWLALNREHRQAFLEQFNLRKSIAFLSALLVIVFASAFNSKLNTETRKYHSMHTTVSQQFNSINKISKKELSVRTAYNINGIDILMDYPMGVGLGAFHTIYPNYFNSSRLTPKAGYNLGARPRRMHNDMFQAFIELGVIGGAAHLFIFLSPLFMAWRISKQKKTTNKTKLFSFFTLLAIAGMSINSLGDFPLQMPTAPGVLWLLVGIMTGLYAMNVKNASIGKIYKINLPSKAIFAPLAIITVVCFGFITYDDYMRREGALYLKPALGLSRSGKNNDTTLYFISKSHKFYDLNPREREIHGVIFMSHKADKPDSKSIISFERRLETLKGSLLYDPYAQNTLINIAMLDLREAQRVSRDEKDIDKINKLVQEAYEYSKRAVPLSYYTPNAHTVHAISLLFLNNGQGAYNHFKAALKINPNYTPALDYLKKLKPLVDTGKITP